MSDIDARLATTIELIRSEVHALAGKMEMMQSLLLTRGRGTSTDAQILDEIDRLIDDLTGKVHGLRLLLRGHAGETVNVTSAWTVLEIVSGHISVLPASTVSAVGPDIWLLMPEQDFGFVMYELLWNSIQHSPPRAGKVQIAVTARVEGDHCVIEVEDDGPGLGSLDAASHERIFDPGSTTDEAGTGYGLCLVRRVVEAADGSVHSEPGKTGLRVVVEIPGGLREH